jgi:hypothetical protein
MSDRAVNKMKRESGVHTQTPTEYFKELVEEAIERQNVSSSELSSFYLVHLLDSFVRPDRASLDGGVDYDKPLAYLLCKAIGSGDSRRLVLFKATGDISLFMSGFFSDSLNRKVDFDYYISMGGYAYGRAARLSSHPPAAEIFEELSQKFVRFVDVLTEVSERSSLTDNQSLLRLYEKWLLTGSERTGAMLREQGVLPAPGSKLIQ